MALTDLAIRNAKPGEKPRRLSDAGGLFWEVHPGGSKYWRLAYRFGGKQKTLALGVYPAVSLSAAREKRERAKKNLADGVDPSLMRKMIKAGVTGAASFETVAREWHGKFSPGWAASHANKIIGRFELHVFPWIGARPVGEISAPELLTMLRRIEAGGKLETAHRALQNCGQVFRYAVATGRADRDPSGDLRGAMAPPTKKHFATITDPSGVGSLLRAIDSYSGAFIVRCGLRLAPLVFTRPGELRMAQWSEFDLEGAEWRIPVERMKRGTREKIARKGEVGHIVPLSRQAVAVLRELHQLTGKGRFLFPGLRSKDRPISDATLTNALRRMGYSGDEMTVHGFRHMASTMLHEHGFPSHVIEKQLSHGDRNRIRAVYNHAEYLPERRKMMQAWADYLDQLKSGAKIIPFRAAEG